MPVSPALLLLCAAIPAASAFAPVFSLSAPRHSGFAARVSHVGPTAAGWAGLRGSPALRTAHRATRGGAASMIASTAVGVESLADRVAAAQPGDTIILEKGEYTIEGSLVIDKPLTIKSAPGLGYRDVLIQGEAPERDTEMAASGPATKYNRGAYMIHVTSTDVVIQGVSIFLAKGSPGGSLSAGTASVAICCDDGVVDVRECHLYTDTGAAMVVQGQAATVIVSQCRVGPCGWFAQSKAGYGVLARRGGHASVLNSDFYQLSQSGVVAYQAASTAYVNRCSIGPTLLSAVAAEGMRVELQAKDLVITDIYWREVAEFDGGEVVFLDGGVEASKSNDFKPGNTVCRPEKPDGSDSDMPYMVV